MSLRLCPLSTSINSQISDWNRRHWTSDFRVTKPHDRGSSASRSGPSFHGHLSCKESRSSEGLGWGVGLSLRLEVNAEWAQGAVPLDAAGSECRGARAGRCRGRDRASSSGCLSARGGWEMVTWLGLRAQLGLALSGPLKNDTFGRSWSPCSSLLMDSAPGPFETSQAAFGDNWKRLNLPFCWDKCHGPFEGPSPPAMAAPPFGSLGALWPGPLLSPPVGPGQP